MSRLVGLVILAWALVAAPSAAFASEAKFNELLNQIVNEVWGPFQLKQLQMLETYNPRISADGSVVEIYSAAVDPCHGARPVSDPVEVAHDIIKSGRTDRGYYLNVSHSGCDGVVYMHEQWSVEGLIPDLPDPAALVLGVRHFDLHPYETRKQVVFSDGFEQMFFGYQVERTPDGQYARVWLGNDPAITIRYSRREQSIRILSGSFSAEFIIPHHGKWQVTWNGDESDMLISYNETVPRYFLESNTQDESLNQFKTAFKDRVLQKVEYSSKGYLEALLRIILPPSQFASSGSSNDRLIEELRKMIENVRTGRDTDRVIRQLLQYIELAKSGELLDRRPQ